MELTELSAMQRRTTLFKQLIISVILPAVIAMLVLGVFNFRHTDTLLKNAHLEKNQIITNEIRNFLGIRDFTLELIEERMNNKIQSYSNSLVNDYFSNTKEIKSADLNKIREELGMDPEREDIYIIDRNGIIINTTFEQDLGLNLFDFGEAHKNHLLSVFKSAKFISERFAVENHTRKLKKYSYQATFDGKYIIELGVYSKKADEVIDIMQDRLDELSEQQSSIVSVHLFIGADNPFSLSSDVKIDTSHLLSIKALFREKGAQNFKSIIEGKELSCDYIYMERENTDLYKGSVIRIVSDRSTEKEIIRKELFKFIAIFLATIFIVIVLIYRQTKVITDPIRKLVDSVIHITDGRFNERAEVLGNNEITTLSQKFNMMIEQLESYYNDLEQKVKERTAEVIQQKEEIEAQNENLLSAYTKIEQHQKHITDSIHYASRIQNAILPPSELVKKVIPDSFILYNPKDIVSGDFYWMSEKDDKLYFAAVDCTGHGVPGAFMSIVGHNQLNHAVNVKGARTPGDILSELNKGVTDTLRQKFGTASVKDGMDIALCCIDKKRKKVSYAGAYNPLLYVRDGEMEQLKGDRAPIGAFVEEELHKFTNHEIDLKEGDVYYIFSDGYADQFGGEKGKKFMSKRFRDLLLSNHKKTMEKQMEILLQNFIDWKGKEPQIDDILVIGVKI